MTAAHFVFNLEAEWPVERVRRTVSQGEAGCLQRSGVGGGLRCTVVPRRFF